MLRWIEQKPRQKNEGQKDGNRSHALRLEGDGIGQTTYIFLSYIFLSSAFLQDEQDSQDEDQSCSSCKFCRKRSGRVAAFCFQLAWKLVWALAGFRLSSGLVRAGAMNRSKLGIIQQQQRRFFRRNLFYFFERRWRWFSQITSSVSATICPINFGDKIEHKRSRPVKKSTDKPQWFVEFSRKSRTSFADCFAEPQ